MAVSNELNHNKIDFYNGFDIYDLHNNAGNIAAKSVDERVEKGLNFILRHIPPSQPAFPRHIMTSVLGYPREVYNKEAVQYFKHSNYSDCKIRAYPTPSSISDFLGTNIIPPATIKIDLDRSNFQSDNSHRLVLTKTLANIRQCLDGRPTVLWSGKGYHIYQPIDAPTALENIKDFKDIQVQQTSVKFLRFADWYLSNEKSDPSHTNSLSFGNCLLRIPGSHNHKCVTKNNDVLDSSTTKILTILVSEFAFVVDFLVHLWDLRRIKSC